VDPSSSSGDSLRVPGTSSGDSLLNCPKSSSSGDSLLSSGNGLLNSPNRVKIFRSQMILAEAWSFDRTAMGVRLSGMKSLRSPSCRGMRGDSWFWPTAIQEISVVAVGAQRSHLPRLRASRRLVRPAMVTSLGSGCLTKIATPAFVCGHSTAARTGLLAAKPEWRLGFSEMASRLLPVRFLEYLSSVTFAASVAFWLLVVYRFVSYDENHVGWNILLAIPVFFCRQHSFRLGRALYPPSQIFGFWGSGNSVRSPGLRLLSFQYLGSV